MRARRTARDTVIWLAATAGIVALVLGASIIGAVLLAFALWQLVLVGPSRRRSVRRPASRRPPGQAHRQLTPTRGCPRGARAEIMAPCAAR